MVSEAIHTLESEQRKEVRSREAGFVELDARLQSLEAVVEEQRSQIEGLLAKAEEYERLEEQRRIEEQKRVEKQKRLAELRRKRQLEQKRIENEKRKREALTASGGDEPAADTGEAERSGSADLPLPDTAANGAVAVEENEKNTYTAAYLAYKSGRLDEAAKGFNRQLDLYPQGEYVDQAWYWLGETRYEQHGYTLAINAFKHIAEHYPQSGKHAAALLRLGQTLQALKYDRDAMKYYDRLIKEHAGSEAAEKARIALAAMKKSAADSKERQQ